MILGVGHAVQSGVNACPTRATVDLRGTGLCIDCSSVAYEWDADDGCSLRFFFYVHVGEQLQSFEVFVKHELVALVLSVHFELPVW